MAITVLLINFSLNAVACSPTGTFVSPVPKYSCSLLFEAFNYGKIMISAPSRMTIYSLNGETFANCFYGNISSGTCVAFDGNVQILLDEQTRCELDELITEIIL